MLQIAGDLPIISLHCGTIVKRISKETSLQAAKASIPPEKHRNPFGISNLQIRPLE
jgi:hypothetical protein